MQSNMKVDISNMMGLVDNFPNMLKEVNIIAKEMDLSSIVGPVKNIVVIGMGGSAFGGDVIVKLLLDKTKLPAYVVRDYKLPEFVGSDTLVIAASYSGNTEETLSSYDNAIKVGAKIFAIASGGKLLELSKKNGHPYVVIPGGLPPRASLPYLLVPMLYAIQKMGIYTNSEAELAKAMVLLDELKAQYNPESNEENNLAKQIAAKLVGKIPVVFGTASGSFVAAYRWKTQFNENSKVTALINSFPELNHNEIVNLADPAKKENFVVVLLSDHNENERTKARIDITKAILIKKGIEIIEVQSQGEDMLSRILSLSYLGDYVSVYLAILYNIDPTPVEPIDILKMELSKI